MRRLVWFSCGAASAVAARVAIDAYAGEAEVVYCNTLASEHPDNVRFFEDVRRWIGRDITVISSDRYATVDHVFARRRYMAGVGGAICTTEMKKIPRESMQRPDDVHVFGYTADEQDRADKFEQRNPSLRVEWALIDRGITKEDCLAMLRTAGIALPAMYALGFEHNNCLGCVKATSPAYWNRIRRLFPDVFARRAAQSREIGARLVRVKNVRVFLDELAPDVGLDEADGDIDCGPACQIPLPGFGEP